MFISYNNNPVFLFSAVLAVFTIVIVQVLIIQLFNCDYPKPDLAIVTLGNCACTLQKHIMLIN